MVYLVHCPRPQNFYMITKGAVDIIKEGNVVAVKKESEVFGELELMYNTNAVATVKVWGVDDASAPGFPRLRQPCPLPESLIPRATSQATSEARDAGQQRIGALQLTKILTIN